MRGNKSTGSYSYTYNDLHPVSSLFYLYSRSYLTLASQTDQPPLWALKIYVVGAKTVTEFGPCGNTNCGNENHLKNLVPVEILIMETKPVLDFADFGITNCWQRNHLETLVPVDILICGEGKPFENLLPVEIFIVGRKKPS